MNKLKKFLFLVLLTLNNDFSSSTAVINPNITLDNIKYKNDNSETEVEKTSFLTESINKITNWIERTICNILNLPTDESLTIIINILKYSEYFKWKLEDWEFKYCIVTTNSNSIDHGETSKHISSKKTQLQEFSPSNQIFMYSKFFNKTSKVGINNETRKFDIHDVLEISTKDENELNNHTININSKEGQKKIEMTLISNKKTGMIELPFIISRKQISNSDQETLINFLNDNYKDKGFNEEKLIFVVSENFNQNGLEKMFDDFSNRAMGSCLSYSDYISQYWGKKFLKKENNLDLGNLKLSDITIENKNKSLIEELKKKILKELKKILKELKRFLIILEFSSPFNSTEKKRIEQSYELHSSEKNALQEKSQIYKLNEENKNKSLIEELKKKLKKMIEKLKGLLSIFEFSSPFNSTEKKRIEQLDELDSSEKNSLQEKSQIYKLNEENKSTQINEENIQKNK